MTKEVNNPNSQNDVISTATHVLFSFEQMILQEMPDIAIVLDEQLSYPTAMAQFLKNNSDNEQDPLPMFAYNRTVSRPSDQPPARRGRNYNGVHTVDGSNLKYAASHDEFDINFVYFTKSIELLEKFEVTYNADEGITGSKELIVNMQDLGEFKYFLNFEDLSDIQFEVEDVFYRGIAGSVKVRGFYFVFRGRGGIIKEINTKIFAAQNVQDKTQVEEVGSNQIKGEEQ